MIEPIGLGDSKLSPYDRYSQYQQMSGSGGGAKVNDLWDNPSSGRLGGRAAVPGQTSAPGQIAVPGQITAPGKSSASGEPAVTGTATAPGQVAAPAQAVAPGQPVTNEQALPDAAARGKGTAGRIAATAPRECQTCKNRKYQDQSDDSGVSYQSPTHISPAAAGSAVRAHENEHVTREQAKAKRQGREVISQSVVIKTAICPECGRVYVAGGTTKTVTREKSQDNKFQVGQPNANAGLYFNENV